MRSSRLTAVVAVALALAGWSCRSDHPGAAGGTFVLPADYFPIMCWEPPRRAKEDLFSNPHSGLPSISECGFNTVGFVRPKHLATCERLGMKAIVCPEGGQIEWAKLSDQEIFNAVKKLI